MSHLLSVVGAYFNNQIFAGGFLLMASGAVMALCRSIPKRAWNAVMERFTITVTVRYPDLSFDYLVAWLNSIPYSKRARRLEATVDKQNHDDDDAQSRTRRQSRPRIAVTHGPRRRPLCGPEVRRTVGQ